MNKEKVKQKIEEIRDSKTTKEVVAVGKQILTAVVVGVAIKVTMFVLVEGTKALVAEVNKSVNG